MGHRKYDPAFSRRDTPLAEFGGTALGYGGVPGLKDSTRRCHTGG
jgi:hypothetical protein